MINDPSLSSTFGQVPLSVLLPVLVALFAALAFEFVNGFHDASNAVATVIYTRSMRATHAVIFSGLFDFLGVLAAGVGVAYSIVNLFPTEMLLSDQAAGATLSMVFAVLCAAILWNLGTWYLGIPVSSSHTMIGAIVGASMGYSMHLNLPLDQGVPWDKVRSVIAALFFSPLVGFCLAALLLMVMRLVIRDQRLYDEPQGEQPPPNWIRAMLIAACGGVSFSHGSNDGQKGMGLIMLVMMALLPAGFSLNLAVSPAERLQLAARCQEAAQRLPCQSSGISLVDANRLLNAYLDGKIVDAAVAPVLSSALLETAHRLQSPLEEIPAQERALLRVTCQLECRALRKLSADPALLGCADGLENFIQYVSTWIKLAVALALGFGVTIGWKRVVVTVGEKIGKSHLSYAQGLTAQLVTSVTILLANIFRMPVSTTHVLSSGIAGSMSAQGSGLQRRTLAMILTAWVLTLPVCITLGMGLFFLFLKWA